LVCKKKGSIGKGIWTRLSAEGEDWLTPMEKVPRALDGCPETALSKVGNRGKKEGHPSGDPRPHTHTAVEPKTNGK